MTNMIWLGEDHKDQGEIQGKSHFTAQCLWFKKPWAVKNVYYYRAASLGILTNNMFQLANAIFWGYSHHTSHANVYFYSFKNN